MPTPTPVPQQPPKARLSEAHYVQIPLVLVNQVADGDLETLDVLVFGVLYSFLGQNKAAWPSNLTVAESLGKGVTTVRRSISRLERRGHIRREQKNTGTTAHTYFLTCVKAGKVCVGKPVSPARPASNPVAVVTAGVVTAGVVTAGVVTAAVVTAAVVTAAVVTAAVVTASAADAPPF